MAKKRKNKKKVEETLIVNEPKKVSFESWYFVRSKKIPSKHVKEIIVADFKARGLTSKETMDTFDNALTKYGVKLQY